MSGLRDLRRTLWERFRERRPEADDGFLPPPAEAAAGPTPAGFLAPVAEPEAGPREPRRPISPAVLPDPAQGAEEATRWGPCLRLAPTLDEGLQAQLATALRDAPAGTGRLAEALRPPRDRLLFLDLETCGLRDAPLFLCGLARVGERVELELLLARSRREEAAVIAAAGRRLSTASGLVTFNGAAFDVPFLTARAAAFEQPLSLPAPHLDLLPVARRRFGRRFGDCRLVTLEQHLCGRRRAAEDVPGAEIPAIYDAFCAAGDASLLRPILYHNAMDLLAMIDLLQRMAAPVP